jgi:hypothetical protein
MDQAIRVRRPPVRLKLAGRDGNAFMLMRAFQLAAESEGWTQAEIQAVEDQAMSGDYNHLLAVLANNTTTKGL